MHAVNDLAVDRFRDLFAVVRELIKRIADTEDLHLRSVRAKIWAGLASFENDMTPIVTYNCRTSMAGAHEPRDIWNHPAVSLSQEPWWR
ncbi:MAG: hypothetical protein M3N50_03630 [Pseudomonadota bacterium]|nr:hypothetical protein [Pseudomonadota bacterium]